MNKSKIKIIFVIDNLTIGGAGLLTIDLINNMPESEFDIKLLSLTENKDKENNLKKYLRNQNVCNELDIHSLKIYQRIKVLRNYLSGFDIVHSCLESANFYCGLVNLLYRNKSKYVATVHGIDGVFIDSPQIQEALKKTLSIKYYYSIKYIQNYLFKKYDRIICVSNDTRSFLVNKRRIKESKLFTIYYGLDFNNKRLTNSIDESEMKSIREFIGDDFVVGYLGRLSKGKGLVSFIETFSDLKKDYKNIKLLFIGDGELLFELKSVIRTLGLEEFVMITGYKSNLKDYYSCIDLFVLPSESEGLPITLIEAMYYKVITLSSNVGGIPEIVKNEFNGFLFDNKRRNELKEKIKFIIENYKNIDFVRQNAFDDVIKDFDLRINAVKIVNLFKEVILEKKI